MATVYTYAFDNGANSAQVAGGGTPGVGWWHNNNFVFSATYGSGNVEAHHVVDGTAYPNLQDGNGGNVEVSGTFRLPSYLDPGNAAQLIGRMTVPTVDANFTGYNLILQCGTTQSLTLYQRLLGVTTSIGTPISSIGNLDATTHYTMLLDCIGTTISARIQRDGTGGGGGSGTWLKSDGTWWTDGTTPAITATNSAIGGQGYAGIRQNGLGNYISAFTFSTVAPFIFDIFHQERLKGLLVISQR